MANALSTKKVVEISTKGANALVSSIKDGLALVSKGYLVITPDVAKLYDCKGFKALGYKNFDEMCALEFGMSHGTTVGIRKVFDKFGSVSKDNKYSIPEKYLEYGYTKLLLFTDKKFDEAGIDPIEEFTPDMTISDMREALSLKLEAKADKQDKEAIDTESKDVSRETSEEASEEITASAEEANPIEEAKEHCDEIIALVEMIREKAQLKPEKSALLDAIIANTKEVKKSIK